MIERIFPVLNKQFSSLKSLVFVHYSSRFISLDTKQLIPRRIPPTQHNDFQHNSKQNVTLSITMLCYYAEWRILFIIMLNDVMLSVVMLNVVMQTVVAPDWSLPQVEPFLVSPFKPFLTHKQKTRVEVSDHDEQPSLILRKVIYNKKSFMT